MPKIHRISGTVALMVCLAGTQWSETVLADAGPAVVESIISTSPVPETQPLALPQSTGLTFGEHTRRALALASSSPSTNGLQPLGAATFAQRGWYRGRGRRNGAAQAEMILGAVAAITGAAVLTYANRPECRVNAIADGCGYSTKVVGTAVTAGGVATFLIGAFTWR